jgi:hypothetical protein
LETLTERETESSSPQLATVLITISLIYATIRSPHHCAAAGLACNDSLRRPSAAAGLYAQRVNLQKSGWGLIIGERGFSRQSFTYLQGSTDNGRAHPIIYSWQLSGKTAIVDVHLLMFDHGHVLLGKRQNTGFDDGCWHLPSGHLEPGETIAEAAAREAHEDDALDSLLALMKVRSLHAGGAVAAPAWQRLGYGRVAVHPDRDAASSVERPRALVELPLRPTRSPEPAGTHIGTSTPQSPPEQARTSVAASVRGDSHSGATTPARTLRSN